MPSPVRLHWGWKRDGMPNGNGRATGSTLGSVAPEQQVTIQKCLLVEVGKLLKESLQVF